MTWALDDTAVVEQMIRATGGLAVSAGGVSSWGHFEHVPAAVGDDPGAIAGDPSLVVAAGALPGIGLDDGAGSARGIGQAVQVGDHVWTVRNVEPGLAPGEIRLLLANR